MIRADQPAIFGSHLVALLSSATDGTMKDGTATAASDATVGNYETFLTTAGIDPSRAVYATLTLDDYLSGKDFTRYLVTTATDEGRGPRAPILGFDGMATNERGRALAMPPADCPVAVIYDPDHRALMVSHLGRHSVEQYGARRSVEFMADTYASDPSRLLVWVGPSPNAETYPMWAFENRGINNVIAGQLREAGVLAGHIELSRVDTVTNMGYFSHSEFLKGNRPVDGRFVVAAMIPE